MTEAPARPRKAPSAVTAASNAFVAARLEEAATLGERLATCVAEPEAFVGAIQEGFRALGDPAAAAGARGIAPGLTANVGVRLPLMEAAHKAFKAGTRRADTTSLIELVDRLLADETPEVRWFGIWNLVRLLPGEPDRTWQLLRRAAREAGEWITVDTLAHPYGEGILRDPRRWSELERLTTSTSRWERRLVGSTLATIPHVKHVAAKDGRVVPPGLNLVGQLIGDAEPDVQKALSWALRTFAQLDPAATVFFLEAEAEEARRTRDGNRTWVIRDTLSKLPPQTAANLRMHLAGIRRGSHAVPASSAATTAINSPRPAPHQGPAGASGRISAP